MDDAGLRTDPKPECLRPCTRSALGAQPALPTLRNHLLRIRVPEFAVAIESGVHQLLDLEHLRGPSGTALATTRVSRSARRRRRDDIPHAGTPWVRFVRPHAVPRRDFEPCRPQQFAHRFRMPWPGHPHCPAPACHSYGWHALLAYAKTSGPEGRFGHQPQPTPAGPGIEVLYGKDVLQKLVLGCPEGDACGGTSTATTT